LEAEGRGIEAHHPDQLLEVTMDFLHDHAGHAVAFGLGSLFHFLVFDLGGYALALFLGKKWGERKHHKRHCGHGHEGPTTGA
jgi:hypothetical protein